MISKFKIWSKNDNRWLDDEVSLHCLCRYYLDANGNVVCVTITPSGTGVEEVSDVEVVHHTGIDNIYEGDILEIEYKGTVIKGVVRWDVLNCSFLVNNTGICGPEQKVKILGNIFENPELLTD